ncbi:MAG: sugar ABC transporter permease [Chloroflexota bacterium]|nr:sugar ABC transporter permease [Chloroflexota bacterium]
MTSKSVSADRSNPSNWTLTNKRREAIAGYLFLTPYLFFFLVFLAGPVISAFVTAFVEWELLRGTYRFIGLENFQLIMEDDLFWIALGNSLYFATMTTVGNVIVALCAALALKSIRLGHTLFRVVMYAPVVLSISVIGIVFSRLLAPFGLLNAGLELFGHDGFNYLADPNLVLPSLSLTTIWWGFGFPMLIFLAALYAVPEALYEAARIDGAGRWQILWQVTLPLIRPALLFIIVTQFIAHIQVFGQPYIMTNGGGPGYSSYTIVLHIYRNAFSYYHMGYAGAMALSLGVVMFIFALVQFRLLGRYTEY